MALTSILATPGKTAIFFFSRGNIGVITDIQSKSKNTSLIPLVTGGGGGEHSYTF